MRPDGLSISVFSLGRGLSRIRAQARGRTASLTMIESKPDVESDSASRISKDAIVMVTKDADSDEAADEVKFEVTARTADNIV